ncbi:MAG: tRNA (guanine(6)-N2)-methyltransferase [Candidatus Methanomethylicia archaeon]
MQNLITIMYDLVATTNWGLEDICGEEVRRITKYNIDVDVNKIFFRGNIEDIYIINMTSRTIHKLIIVLYRGRFNDLNDIYKIAKNLSYVEYIKPDQSFAIRTVRTGSHDFTSIEAAAKIGKGVIDSYMMDTGVRLKVNLDRPDIEVLCLIRNEELIIGINTTGDSLHRRGYRVYNHPAALKSTIASAMLMYSKWRGEPVLDPMCGGGTIIIEAALMARNIPILKFRRDYAFRKLKIHDENLYKKISELVWSKVNYGYYEIYGFEISPKHIHGAYENLVSADVNDTVKLFLRDAIKIDSYIDLDPKYIIVNPPYGLREKRTGYVEELYRKFLESISDIYSGLTLTLITAAKQKFLKTALEIGIKIIDVRHVMHGRLETAVFKCIL